MASIKSMLNKSELENALRGIAAIPSTSSLEHRVSFTVTIKNYDDWPYKIVYASDGISAESLFSHLISFYEQNPGIPYSRRPNVIHVAGKYVILRAIAGMSEWDIIKQGYDQIEEGKFRLYIRDPDIQGILWSLDGIQTRATASTHILYSYGEILNKVNGLPPVPPRA